MLLKYCQDNSLIFDLLYFNMKHVIIEKISRFSMKLIGGNIDLQ